MGNHALLSPSSSHRWLKCTPSAVLETEFENKSSNAAEEGTAFHALCEHKLKKALRRRSKRPVSTFNTDEMEEHSDAYVEFVMEQLEKAKQTCSDPLVLIEQKVDLSEYVPDSYGTADCLIVSEDNLHIIDAKYGLGVLVEVAENPQLMCYGIAALGVYESLYDIKEVSLSVFQPRRENFFYTTSECPDMDGIRGGFKSLGRKRTEAKGTDGRQGRRRILHRRVVSVLSSSGQVSCKGSRKTAYCRGRIQTPSVTYGQ